MLALARNRLLEIYSPNQVRSFNKHLPSTYYVLGTVLSTEDLAMSNEFLLSWNLHCSVGRRTTNTNK